MMGMKLIRMSVVMFLLAFAACGLVLAQDHSSASDPVAQGDMERQAVIENYSGNMPPEAMENDEMGPWRSIAYLGACLGAGLGVIGGGMGIGKIAGSATEGISRQPEAAGQMFLAWLIPAAMVEGMALFAIVICFMITMKK